MITYVPELIKLIKEGTGKVPVTTTYPDTNICPIVIVYESNQSEILKCSAYEHASSTIIIEIYTRDIPTKQELKNSIDVKMRSLNFELTKKEDIDNTQDKIYVTKLTYDCELIQRGDSLELYKKKF